MVKCRHRFNMLVDQVSCMYSWPKEDLLEPDILNG